jgi:type II restriction enzyme
VEQIGVIMNQINDVMSFIKKRKYNSLLSKDDINNIITILNQKLTKFGLCAISAEIFENRKNNSLSIELRKVLRNICVDYDESGLHFPEIDIIIYNPISLKIFTVLSSKFEIANSKIKSGLWFFLFNKDNFANKINTFFITKKDENTFLIIKPKDEVDYFIKKNKEACIFSYSKINNTINFNKLVNYL